MNRHDITGLAVHRTNLALSRITSALARARFTCPVGKADTPFAPVVQTTGLRHFARCPSCGAL